MQAHQQRVVEEREQVQAFLNLTKPHAEGLAKFMGGATFATVNVEEQNRLRKQLVEMNAALASLQSYLGTLDSRIASF